MFAANSQSHAPRNPFAPHSHAALLSQKHSTAPPTIEPLYHHCAYRHNIYVQVELPGVLKQHISLEIQHSHLVLSAKRFRVSKLAQARTTHAEQPPCAASATEPAFIYALEMRLSHDADADAVRVSSYEDGLLTIDIPLVCNRTVSRKITLDP